MSRSRPHVYDRYGAHKDFDCWCLIPAHILNSVADAIADYQYCSSCADKTDKDEHCAACTTEARIAINAYIKFLPGNWHLDSSLETWFPLTAEQLRRDKAEKTCTENDVTCSVCNKPIMDCTCADGYI